MPNPTGLTPRLHMVKDRQSFVESLKRDAHAAAFEFLGTITFLLLGLGGIQAAASSNAASLAAAADGASSSGAQAINTVASINQLLYIATAMGLSLIASAWIFYRVTGSLFNPNINLALLLAGAIGPLRFVLCSAAQLLGAIVASAILYGILPGTLAVSPALGLGTNRAQAVWIEAFLTAFLCLSVLMLAVEKHRATSLAPVGIGLVLFAGHLLGVPFTGAAMNTARAFGPCVITGFSNEQWIYWLGPAIGSCIAAAVYRLLKYIEYEDIQPGQDAADPIMNEI